MTNATVKMSDETLATINLAIKDSGDTVDVFLSDYVEKAMKAQKKAMARQRLNQGKKQIAHHIKIGIFPNLETAYNKLALSESVAIFGGIRKVYEEIYLKAGEFLPKDKIAVEGLVVVSKEQVEQESAA